MSSRLTKTTHTFAYHQISLECNVYESADYPGDSPVFLFFHSGGLVVGSRIDIPPWLVQTCMARKWPLASASYRFLPQVDGNGLLSDAAAAYDFARTLGRGDHRRVIAGGSSAGAFMETLTAQHLTPKPIAVVSFTEIPSFRHPFFSSSTLLSHCPVEVKDVEPELSEAVSAEGIAPRVFDTAMLLPSGARNSHFRPSSEPATGTSGRDYESSMLYEHFLHTNAFLPMVGDVDPGFEWARDAVQKTRLDNWPVTVIIQGDMDEPVDMSVSANVAEYLGTKGRLFLARGQGHLFASTNFIEDEGPGMDVVRDAVAELRGVVGAALAV